MPRPHRTDDRLLWGQIVENSPDATLVFRLVRDGRGRAAAFRPHLHNPAAARLLDADPLGLRGLLPDRATSDLFDRYASLVSGGEAVSIDKVVPDPSGSVASCWNLEARSLRDEAVLVRIVDVTDRVRAKLRYKQEAERLSLLARRTSDVLAILDDVGRIAWITEASADVLGVASDRLIGTELAELVAPTHRQALLEDRALRRTGKMRVPAASSRGAESRWLEIVLDENGGTRCAVLRDVTTVRQLETQIAELTGSAGLPGVLRKKDFVQQLIKEIARRQRYGRTVSVVALALDGRTGLRKAGALDEAHRALAESATDVLRVADLIGAWGEDVFLLLLPETPVPGGVRACERLNEVLAQRPLAALGGRKISVSAGVVGVDFGDDAKSVLTRALKGFARNRRSGPGSVGVAEEREAA